MRYSISNKLRYAAAATQEQMRDKRVDEVAYKEIRPELDDMGFDVSLWDRRDLLQGEVPVVFQGHPYDLTKKGPDVVLKDGLSNKTIAEFKNATNPGNADKFIELVKKHTERLASMRTVITQRLRFAARLMMSTLDPAMYKAMAPELVDYLVKKGIIPRDKEKEAEKEVLMILQPGKGFVPMAQRVAVLAPEMLDAMKEMAPKMVEHLMKKNIIPQDKKQEAVREISRARIPAPNIPKVMPAE